jgi:hypothetical protein
MILSDASLLKRFLEMKTCAFLVVFCALSVPAFSANHLYDTGNEFLSECSAVDRANDSNLTLVEKANIMQCLSYVQGVIDGVVYENTRVGMTGNSKAPPLPCAPGDVSRLQLVRVALKYVRDNPEKAHMATVVLVMTALENAFSCPR